MTQPQQQPAPQASNTQVLAVLAVITAGLSVNAAADAIVTALKVPRAVALGLVRLHVANPIEVLAPGPSANVINEQELTYRAAYLANAGLRINQRLEQGLGPDEAAAPERLLFRAHRAAQRGRARASRAVDSLAHRVGLRLRWRAVNDRKTSPECRAANGHVFTADHPPVIGLPGAVHPNCRCRPVPASEGTGSTTVDQAVRAANIRTEAA